MYVIFLPNRNQKHFKRIASVAEFSWKYLKKKNEETLYAAIIAFYACIFFLFFLVGSSNDNLPY